jgi:hypothetical protein
MSQSEPGRELKWSVFPFMENLKRSILVIVIVIGCGVVVYAAFKDVFLAILSVVILFASLHTYFTRTTYRLNAEGVEIRTSLAKTFRKWSHFKRYHVDRRGITLSPFAKHSRLEPFRSTRLLYGGNKDDVVEFVSENVCGDPAAEAG